MKLYVAYGCAIALGMALISVFLFFLGYHSDVEKYAAAQFVSSIGCGLIAVAGLSLGIKARRDQLPRNAGFSFGQGVAAGVMISLFTGLFGSVTNYVYTVLVNPKFADIMMQSQVLEAKRAGATEADLAALQAKILTYTHPAIQAGIGCAVALVGGTIISVVVAAVLRRKATASPSR